MFFLTKEAQAHYDRLLETEYEKTRQNNAIIYELRCYQNAVSFISATLEKGGKVFACKGGEDSCMVVISNTVLSGGKLLDLYAYDITAYGNEEICEMQFSYDPEGAIIELVDIHGGICQGHGSLLMECLKQFGRERKIRHIYGVLSMVDMEDVEHRSRLMHFYSKHRFTIIDKDKSIEKIIRYDFPSTEE